MNHIEHRQVSQNITVIGDQVISQTKEDSNEAGKYSPK